MKKIPLFGSSIEALSAVVSAQTRVNCFYEARQDEEKTNLIVRPTPGLTLLSTLPFTIRGLYAVDTTLYAVAGANFYKIDALGVVTFIATMSSSISAVVGMAWNGTQLIAVDGSNGYIYTPSTNIGAKITSANFPNGCTSVVYIDGYFLVNVAGTQQFYKSSLYDGTTWAALDFASAESNPDNVVAIDNMSSTLVLWGSSSIEFWQDTGGFPFPFSRLSGATSQWGLAALWSRAFVGNAICFLAQNSQGAAQVMMLNGYSPTRISTTDIEHLIMGMSMISDAVAYSYMIDGAVMYQLTFPTANKSLLWDSATKMWSVVQSGVSRQGNRHNTTLGVSFNSMYYVTDYLNGNLYKLDQANYTENGAAVLRQITSRHIENDGSYFGISEILLDMDTGNVPQLGQGSDPQLMISVSKDNGRTFGADRIVSIGKVGQYLYVGKATRFGISRDFVFMISCTDPVPFIITYASAVTSIGTNK